MVNKRKLTLAFILILTLLCSSLTGCSCTNTNPDPVAESSSELVESSVKPTEESSTQAEPEKEDPIEYAKKILEKNPGISETELRVQLFQAGYTPEEIKAAAENMFVKAEPPKEESSKIEESSKPEESSESSKTESSGESSKEESSKNESSKEESSKEESSKQEQSEDTQVEDDDEDEESSSGSQTPTQESSKPESSKPESSQQEESSKQQESSKPAESSKPEESKPESSAQQQESQAPTCDHEWVDVTETIHHDEEGHYETVVVQEAWDEVKDVVEEQQVEKIKCRCGMVFDTNAEWQAHSISYSSDDGEDEWDQHSGWSSTVVYEEVVVGTETIHHDAVTEEQWVVDKEAYDETVVTGQKCSKCGATK